MVPRLLPGVEYGVRFVVAHAVRSHDVAGTIEGEVASLVLEVGGGDFACCPVQHRSTWHGGVLRGTDRLEYLRRDCFGGDERITLIVATYAVGHLGARKA